MILFIEIWKWKKNNLKDSENKNYMYVQNGECECVIYMFMSEYAVLMLLLMWIVEICWFFFAKSLCALMRCSAFCLKYTIEIILDNYICIWRFYVKVKWLFDDTTSDEAQLIHCIKSDINVVS